MRHPLATLLVAAALSGSALHGDTLLTKDGRIIDGPQMERAEGHIVIHFENGEIEVPNEMVQEVFLEADTEDIPKKMRRQIEKELAARKKEIEDARAHAEWGQRYQEDTKNFSWGYTIPRHLALGMQERFEAYYEHFKKAWKLKRKRSSEKMLVNFYRNSAQYGRTSGAPASALAYFKFVGRYDLNACFDRLDPIETEMVLYHELSHYVQKLVDEEFRYPHWPGEGVAEYYGGSLYDSDSKKLRIGLSQDGRLAEVKRDVSLDEYLTIKSIVTRDAYTDYTWGWLLVHFFMNTEHRKGFEKYFLGLARDKKVKRVRGAFNLKTVEPAESLRYLIACLKIKDEAELLEVQEQFYDYVREIDFETNAGMERAAVAAKRVGKVLRAKRLFQEAEDAGGLSQVGYYQWAQMIRHEDRGLACSLYEKAIALDPLVGTYYYELGRLLERSDEEESKRLKALAKELDPTVDEYVIDLVFDSGG